MEKLVAAKLMTEVQTLEQGDFVQLVSQLWRNAGYPPLRHISCEVVAGRLMIRGVVPSFYMKQLAQHLAGTVRGVPQIVNELRVCGEK